MKKQKQSNVKKRKRKSKSDTQQTKHETRECDGEDLFDEQEDDTPREERNKYAAVSSLSKWTSQDDLQLKDAIQVFLLIITFIIQALILLPIHMY